MACVTSLVDRQWCIYENFDRTSFDNWSRSGRITPYMRTTDVAFNCLRSGMGFRCGRTAAKRVEQANAVTVLLVDSRGRGVPAVADRRVLDGAGPGTEEA